MTSRLSLAPPTSDERVDLGAQTQKITTVEGVLDSVTHQGIAIDAVNAVLPLEAEGMALHGLQKTSATAGARKIPGTSWSVSHVPTETGPLSDSRYAFETILNISHRDTITLTHDDGRAIPLKVYFRQDNSVALILKVDQRKAGSYVPLTKEDALTLSTFIYDMDQLSKTRSPA